MSDNKELPAIIKEGETDVAAPIEKQEKILPRMDARDFQCGINCHSKMFIVESNKLGAIDI